jgi:hypothetical protein
VLPYSRHLDSAMAGGRPKKCSALTPAPSPKGPGRPLFYSAAVSFGPRLRDSSLEPVILAGRPHLVEYDRQICGPAQPWPLPSLAVSPGARPTI